MKTLGEATAALESVLVKQLLMSSGAFRGSGAAGSSLQLELFAEAVADAVAATHTLGTTGPLERQLGARPEGLPPGPPPAALPGLTSGYGPRKDPLTGQPSFHRGVDLSAPEGTPIPAASGGVVSFAGPRGGYGNAVVVQHPDGTSTLYAHASQVEVEVGQAVAAGDTLARVGQTGRATGPHLHLEVLEHGNRVDPRQALKSYRLRAENEDGGVR